MPPPDSVPTPSVLPPPEARRERNAEASRRRLLDAAEAEFARCGFAGARLRDIADAAGAQPALIHHYFVDKQGLYRAVIDRALVQTSTMSWTVLGSSNDLEVLITGFIDLLVEFHAAHQNLMSLLRHEALAGGEMAAPLLRERSLPIVEAVAALLEERQRSGEVRADVDVREIILAGMSMAVYPFSDASMLEPLLPGCAPRGGGALERRKRAIVEILLGGIRGRS
jgi:TetR/AcrR family transcriptional regulator